MESKKVKICSHRVSRPSGNGLFWGFLGKLTAAAIKYTSSQLGKEYSVCAIKLLENVLKTQDNKYLASICPFNRSLGL